MSLAQTRCVTSIIKELLANERLLKEANKINGLGDIPDFTGSKPVARSKRKGPSLGGCSATCGRGQLPICEARTERGQRRTKGSPEEICIRTYSNISRKSIGSHRHRRAMTCFVCTTIGTTLEPA